MLRSTCTLFGDRQRRVGWLAIPAAGALTGCEGIQSVAAPDGDSAATIWDIAWIMFAGGTAIFVLVMVLSAFALFAPAAWRGWLSSRAAIVVGGLVFPVVVLSLLLLYGLLSAREIVTSNAEDALRISVVGERWWWRVHYLDEQGNTVFATANEIRLPTNRPVTFVLSSPNVIHSFWVPRLAGKLDMIPGRVTQLTVNATSPGTYRGQCAEYCGEQHANMAFMVMAMEPEAFDDWFVAQRRPVDQPVSDLHARGRELFLSYGYGACHTIRGTPAAGVIGPDLTHVGGRLTLAAGMFPNNKGTLAGWISDALHLKPDNLMPSFDVIPGPELRSLAAYLESLK
jgi:cytochrome c oxidase subunit 2